MAILKWIKVKIRKCAFRDSEYPALSLSLSLSLSPDFTSLLLQNVSDHCNSRQWEFHCKICMAIKYTLSLSLFSLSPDFTSLLLQNVSDHCDSRQSEGLTVRFVWPPSILSTILLKNQLEWTSSKCVRNDNCFNSIHYWHLYFVIKNVRNKVCIKPSKLLSPYFLSCYVPPHSSSRYRLYLCLLTHPCLITSLSENQIHSICIFIVGYLDYCPMGHTTWSP